MTSRVWSGLLVSAILAGRTAAADPAFESDVRSYGLGNQPANVNAALMASEHAIADLNGDGALDIVHACASESSPKFSVMLNQGDGTFGAATFTSLAASAPTVAAADYNGDGAIDLAFARWAPGVGNQVYVFRNNGAGGFPTSITVTVGSRPRDVVSGDLDLDGDVDLVTVNQSGSLTMLRNSGTGTFTPTTVPLPSEAQPIHAALGDVNGDGLVDFAYTGMFSADVHLMINNAGSFSGTPALFPVTGGPGAQVEIGDLDGDGDRDLVYARGFEIGIPGAVEWFPNDGAGSFGAGQRVATAYEMVPDDVSLGDVNNDGVTDIVVSGLLFDMGSIAVTRGVGGGIFEPGVTYYSGRGTHHVSARDVDGDGLDDVVCTNSWSQTVKVFRPGPDGVIDLPPTTWVHAQFGYDPVAGDLDNDGDLDALVAESALVASLLNDGSGGFTRVETPQGLGCTKDVHLADLDRDGILDLIATRDNACAPYRLLTMRGRGDGTFDPLIAWSYGPAPHGDTAGGNTSIASLDWDHDGDLDVAVTETSGCPSCDPYRMFLFDGNGNGGFSGLREWFGTASAFLPQRVYTGDFDEDGHPDLVATGGVTFIRGRGDGTFDPPVVNSPPLGATWLAVGDVNGDAHLDVAYVSIGETGANGRGGVTGVMLGDGNGNFTSAGYQWSPYDLDRIPEHGVAIGDVTGDEFPDVVAASTEMDDVLLFRGDGTGAIARAERYGANGRTYRPTIADFTGDGRPDVGIGVAGTLPMADSYFSVLANIGPNPAGVEPHAPVVAGLVFASVLPNPSRGETTLSFRGPPMHTIDLELFDVAGRRLHSDSVLSGAAGLGSFTWGGANESGDPVPPGVYFARISSRETGAGDERRLTILR